MIVGVPSCRQVWCSTTLPQAPRCHIMSGTGRGTTLIPSGVKQGAWAGQTLFQLVIPGQWS
jgi:hypothetical protein